MHQRLKYHPPFASKYRGYKQSTRATQGNLIHSISFPDQPHWTLVHSHGRSFPTPNPETSIFVKQFKLCNEFSSSGPLDTQRGLTWHVRTYSPQVQSTSTAGFLKFQHPSDHATCGSPANERLHVSQEPVAGNFFSVSLTCRLVPTFSTPSGDSCRKLATNIHTPAARLEMFNHPFYLII